MTKLIKSAPWLTLAVALTALALASFAFAADFHSGAQLQCSDCHVMHGSHNGTQYNTGTGFDGLLQYGNINQLCLHCHDGVGDTSAPPVVASGTAAVPTNTLPAAFTYASKFKNSAGFFQGTDCLTTASNLAHNLGGGHVTATQGTWSTSAISGHNTGMVCTDCHDPHAAGNNWRNLVTKPNGVVSAPIVQGTDVYLREAITVAGRDSSTTSTHYDTDAVGFNNTTAVVDWCVACHTNITSSANKHRQNVSVSGVEDGGTHWTSATGNGFGADVSDGLAGIPRVRFAQNGTSYATCTQVDTTNQVFCLTCHKAHGSKFDSAVNWPYAVSTDLDVTAGCNQCHNKGT